VARPGDELLNPHTGQVLRFVSLAQHLLVMESSYVAGAPLAPPHLHPSQEERFVVLSGAVVAVLDGDRRVLDEGDTLTVPPATPHAFGGHPDRDGAVRWEVRPALRTAELFELLFGLADGSRVMPQDGSNPLDEFQAEFRLAPPA
jgi:quercetin dioxygenase-like cupin family protein